MTNARSRNKNLEFPVDQADPDKQMTIGSGIQGSEGGGPSSSRDRGYSKPESATPDEKSSAKKSDDKS